MASRSNFGSFFAVLVASAFLSSLAMLLRQLAVLNLLSLRRYGRQ